MSELLEKGRPARYWEPTRPCACGECRFRSVARCPAMNNQDLFGNVIVPRNVVQLWRSVERY